MFLTKVQVPGFNLHDRETNPGNWIAVFGKDRPSAEYLASLTDPVVFSEARQRLLLARRAIGFNRSNEPRRSVGAAFAEPTPTVENWMSTLIAASIASARIDN
ncbi:hypothetical protein [Dietzia cinnamea]|uniref:hypothetical protein n=1 Tax=Dietzia cinnamea TaxID=321318 RepID=UPI00223B1760|nr:hypothetical protein [Dietzia cinnamea]MCT2141097.1 hypothetical protein [Dietzia cinnamea]MCT2175574.1 hypothetical protein [Dietzia cinnamea]